MKPFAVLFLSAVPGIVFGADAALLSLIPPTAKVLTGVEVSQAEASPFGQYLLSQLKLNSPGFTQFIATTDFDPRQDLTEVIIASDGLPRPVSKQWLAIAAGVFDVSKLTAGAESAGATLQPGTVNVLTFSNPRTSQMTGVAFLDNSIGLMGDLASVQTAVQQYTNKAQANSTLVTAAGNLSATDGIWFITLAPPSQIAAGLPNNSKLNSLLGGNTLASITQVSGGVQFGATVAVSAQAVANSPQNAQALTDVLQFVVGVVQMNQQNNPGAGPLTAWLNTLQSSVGGNVVTVSMALPESAVEQMFQNSLQQGRVRRGKARRRAVL